MSLAQLSPSLFLSFFCDFMLSEGQVVPSGVIRYYPRLRSNDWLGGIPVDTWLYCPRIDQFVVVAGWLVSDDTGSDHGVAQAYQAGNKIIPKINQKVWLENGQDNE